MRILIFDQDSTPGGLAAQLAKLMHVEATAVADEESFWKLLRNERPRVLVLDLELGATDGVEQLRLLAEAHYPGAVILTSVHGARLLSTVRLFGESLGLNIVSTLEKPLHMPALEMLFAGLQAASRVLSAEQLRTAIGNHEMCLDFQPIVSMSPRSLKKLEALIRWDHPSAGLILPGSFLAIAEGDTATIDALADWSIGAAIKAYQVLSELGLSVPIAVNLSAPNLHDRTLPDRLQQRLRAGGMPPDHLCLEFSETAAFKDVTLTMDIMNRLQIKRIRLSIDNFGTGYSSLRLLRQMPFSEIKIDRSFVNEMTTSRDSLAIVKSLIGLAANMGVGCVAEGVENRETADALERIGPCDLQGFWIARPMSVEAVPTWLANWMRSGSAGATLRHDSPLRAAKSQQPSPVVRAAGASSAAGGCVRLSPRQIDVMRLLSEGRSVKEIARQLNLGIGTVKVHLSSAYSALGAHNRVEAVRRAEPVLHQAAGGAGTERMASLDC
nr:EAL domain-containing protein [uncultured Rhodopila sp.]